MATRSITWFPGHMRQAMSALKRVIKGVDLLLEVRDARVPFSSHNPELSDLMRNKRHIVVLNKADVVPKRLHKAAVLRLQQEGLRVVSASCTTASGAQQVMHTALDWLKKERAASELSIMMVLGLPNSGKSSIINAFKLAAKKQGALEGQQAYNKRAKVGATPGLTRQVAGFQVSAEPCVYVLDTPGIMMPAVPSEEVGFRLALAGAIKDSVVGEEAIVRYLLHFLGRDLPGSLQAIKASGPISSAAGSSRAATAQRQHSRLDREATAIRACLHKVLSSEVLVGDGDPDEPWSPDLNGSSEGSAQDWGGVDGLDGDSPGRKADLFVESGLPPWEGAQEEQEFDLASSQYEMLMHCLGVAGARNPSKELGALIRLLKAFREGRLGKFMLDADVVSGT